MSVTKPITLDETLQRVATAAETMASKMNNQYTKAEVDSALALKANQTKLNYMQYTISTSSWSSATTTVNGTAYYTYVVSINAVYDEHPKVSIGSTSILPSAAEQDAFDCIAQAYADSAANTLTLYAEFVPTSNFVILVQGVA